ncbi:MAG: D-glycerate dehydrogenase [Alphaproteobacteria bacterium]|nr:D-glycerate dehydrogenase [Alphaproteobacteria bacterium]
MPTKRRLVMSLPLTADVNARAVSEFDVAPPPRPMSRDEVISAACEHGAEALLVGLNLRLSAEDLNRLPGGVRVIATSSVGFEHIDVAAARSRGIVVANTPDVLTDATADTHMLLLLGACRRVKEHVRNMDGGWTIRNGFAQGLGVEVTGRTMGIVGMGRIGRAVAERARGFRMPILYHNRVRLSPDLEGGAKYYGKLEDMLPHCQVLSLNLPGGQGVLMTAARFAALPEGAIFLNSARGSLVDEEALIEALASGQLGAAGLDVFQKEPGYDQRLNALPNTFLLPHIGSATIETRSAMGMRALDNIAAVLNGGVAPDEVKA